MTAIICLYGPANVGKTQTLNKLIGILDPNQTPVRSKRTYHKNNK